MNFVQPLEFIARSDHLARDSETTGCHYSASRARTFPMEFKSGEYKEHRFWPTFSGRDSGEEGGKLRKSSNLNIHVFRATLALFATFKCLSSWKHFMNCAPSFLLPFSGFSVN